MKLKGISCVIFIYVTITHLWSYFITVKDGVVYRGLRGVFNLDFGKPKAGGKEIVWRPVMTCYCKNCYNNDGYDPNSSTDPYSTGGFDNPYDPMGDYSTN